MTRLRFLAAAVTTAALFSAASASAQTLPTYDHLECFKLRDEAGFAYMATVSLDPIQPNMPGLTAPTECTVKLHSFELCTPVAKTIVKTDDPHTIPAVGQDLVNGFLCYKLKCPNKLGEAFQAGDQFGVRSVTATTVTRLCAPADW